MATCTLACETQEAIIRYTTNGVDPTETDTVYSVPFTVETGTTVKAKAWKNGMIASAVASAEAPEPLTPTSVPLGSVLSDGSVVIYDRGSTYGDYNLTSGVLTRLSDGVDDESASSNNWRFLIADSADMEGNNGGTGDNKPWGPDETVDGLTADSEDSGIHGLPNTNILIEKYGSDPDYLWYQVNQKRVASNGLHWYVPDARHEYPTVYDAQQSSYITGLVTSENYFSSDQSTQTQALSVTLASDARVQTPKSSTDCRVRLLRRY